MGPICLARKFWGGIGVCLPQFSDLSWLSPFGLAPLTTYAQVNKSERKLRDFAQVRVILAGAP